MDAPATQLQDDFSDYYSDFTADEEEVIVKLLQQAPPPISDPPPILKDIEDHEDPRGAKFYRRLDWKRQTSEQTSMCSAEEGKRRVTIQVDRDQAVSPGVESAESRDQRQRTASIERPLDPLPEVSDLRSPLERFRTKPKKTLSVTDLVSPSWCELQYWYTLTKHGRKRRTPAMKQGSAVHKTLEDQDHQTIAVETTSKEDAWGLRIWNTIQGLKGLQDTGMTRELEVWGVIDGLVVNGVIDELSYICPDRELEEAEEKGKAIKVVPAADQATITDFLGPATLENNSRGVLTDLRSLRKKTSKVYITDVKTRGVKTVPKGASLRPTLMQLMLYHRLLSDLATNQVDADILFDRYGLDQNAQFTDGFIARLGSLDEVYYDAPSDASQSDTPPDPTQDTTTVLLGHNSLRQLWSLMIQEFRHTIPAGVKGIGNVLRAEYRGQSDGEILGIKDFLYDGETIQGYIEDEMRWWKGEREARGVCIEEAYKCGYCEFAEDCSWRKDKIEEATLKMRGRTRSVI